MNYQGRQARVAAALGEDCDALLVTDLTNVRYLCGYVGSNGILLITSSRRFLFTDFRYLESAASQTDGVEIVEAGRDLHEKLATVISAEIPRGRMGFESAQVTVDRHERFSKALPDISLVPTSGIVETLRLHKDEDEIAAMARAAAIADTAFAACANGLFRARTEREVAWELEGIMRAGGAEGASFDIIVAAGERGARPHAVPADEAIPVDTLVVVDMGAVVDGYVSDCTRTFATGVLSEELARIYEICATAQESALAAVAPGIGAAELDAIARAVIIEAGYGDNFRHGLGHGAGLEVHESPGARPESTDTLRTGMTITVEPGIYVPGVGGVRIEDLCVVTEDGKRVLTAFPKTLMTVDS